MAPIASQIAIERQEVARAEQRISFLYVEHATVNRDGNALTIMDQNGVVHVPATTLAALLLGPGTRITHAGVALLGDSGVSIVWVGEKGVRFYACGRPPAKSSRMAQAQARIVTNQRSRLQCARKMYQMRFPGEDVSLLTMGQLRGREGARMKRIYAEESERTGVEWGKRSYNPEVFEDSDAVNQALTAANAALYGITHAVIVALGFIPSLGIVHTGTDRSLVYDIADLYKAEISIPAAFDCVAAEEDQWGSRVRRYVRDQVVSTRLMQRMVRDLMDLMEVPEAASYDAELMLWSELEEYAAGINWASRDEVGVL